MLDAHLCLNLGLHKKYCKYNIVTESFSESPQLSLPPPIPNKRSPAKDAEERPPPLGCKIWVCKQQQHRHHEDPFWLPSHGKKHPTQVRC